MESMDIVEPERNFPQFPIRLDVNIEISIRFFPPPRKDRGDFFLPPSSRSSYRFEFDCHLSTIVESNVFDRSFCPSVSHSGHGRRVVRLVLSQSAPLTAFPCFSLLSFFHIRSKGKANERNLTKMAILDQSYRVVRIHTIFCIQ